MIARPAWVDPRFRLIEDGRACDWRELAAMAGAFVPADGRVEAMGTSAATVIAALAAAEASGAELFLRRRSEGDPPPSTPPDGFAVVLQTSGTTGAPKPVRHRFDRLCGRLRGTSDPEVRWLLTYEPASFAGLQVILTAAAAGAALVSAPGAPVPALADAAASAAVTHVSATPSFWRALLVAGFAMLPGLRGITLGGEAADQPLLDRLAESCPDARIRHIYASTEAGALFAVTDGRAGFPAAWLDDGVEDVRLRVTGGVLEVLSPRAMAEGGSGWLETGDLVEVVGDRVVFVGRADGRINVGGVKVSPERAERCLLAVPGVADALVEPAPSPIVGHILTATVVPRPGADEAVLRVALRDATAALEPAARPRVIRFAPALPLSGAGKKRRGMPT